MDRTHPHLTRGIEDSPAGRIAGLASDSKHGFSKKTQESLNFLESVGIEGDAHAGRLVQHRYLARYRPTLVNKRQVHLIPAELLDELNRENFALGPGALGENILTAGLDLEIMPLGTVLKLGPDAAIELTGLRTPCVLIDRFRMGLKQQMIVERPPRPKFRCGVMAIVRASGKVALGDAIIVEFPTQPWQALPAL
jgi:MOSC domain-containing protein YiiM